NLCYQGQASYCALINRVGGSITEIFMPPVNLAVQKARGLDLEGSYRIPMDDLVSGWAGNIGLHGNATLYFKNYTNNGLSTPTDSAGQNAGGSPPDWRFTATLSYNLDPVTASFTGRAVSSGTYNNSWITCTSGCPTSTIDNMTINDNHIAGAFYMD